MRVFFKYGTICLVKLFVFGTEIFIFLLLKTFVSWSDQGFLSKRFPIKIYKYPTSQTYERNPNLKWQDECVYLHHRCQSKLVQLHHDHNITLWGEWNHFSFGRSPFHRWMLIQNEIWKQHLIEIQKNKTAESFLSKMTKSAIFIFIGLKSDHCLPLSLTN